MKAGADGKHQKNKGKNVCATIKKLADCHKDLLGVRQVLVFNKTQRK